MNDIIFVPTKKYVYFDEYGNILSVGNSNSSDGNYIEVTPDLVQGLINGTEFLHNYIVMFDTIEKKHILKQRFVEEETSFDVNKQIFQIEKNKNQRSDLIVYQDIKNKKWKFSLDSAIKDNIKNKTLSFQQMLFFAITKYNDPHELLNFFTIDFKTLIDGVVKMPFTTNLELDPTAVSVYTLKRLDTYHHEVINEQ
jgi:hypothetical protein